MDTMNNDWGLGNGFGWIIWLVILLVIIGVVVNAMRQKKNNRPKYNSPHDIFKIRMDQNLALNKIRGLTNPEVIDHKTN